MRAYIYSVVCMAAVGGIVLIVSPDGMRSGIKKHIRLICSLCMLCVMISPVTNLLESIRDIGHRVDEPDDDGYLQGIYESIYDASSEGYFGDGVGNAVKDQLFERFGISPRECRTLVEFCDENGDGFREPKKITVILSGSSVFRDPRQIEGYISGKFGCQCVCAVE